MIAAFYQGNKAFVLQHTVPKPPGNDEVCIKVAYCGICGTDLHIYHGDMDKRVQAPQVIGHEASGVISEIGKGVKNISIGDKVTVRPLLAGPEEPSDRGQSHIGSNLKFIGIDKAGAMQSYWNVPASLIHKLPEAMPLEVGAMIEPLAVACHDIRMSRLKGGENVVVLGGGPIGVLIAMVAQHKKANVWVVEPNSKRAAIIEQLGISVMDPSRSNIRELIYKNTKGAMADVVFEVAGVQATTEMMTDLACARGRIIMVAIHSQPKQVDLFRFFWRELELIGVRVYEPQDFEEAIKLTASGALDIRKIITQIKPLEAIQEVFKEIDQNPEMMKCLLAI